MIFGTVLINLRLTASFQLTFLPSKVPLYNGPDDDIIVFAFSSQSAKLNLVICNNEEFGMLLEPAEPNWLDITDDVENMNYLKLEALYEGPPGLHLTQITAEFAKPLMPSDKLGFDEVYLINLERRPNRLNRMKACFDIINVDFRFFSAVDGFKLNQSYIK